MRIGIVGSEGKKFTEETEKQARALIRSLLAPGDVVVSGGCHLGGIDIWAVNEAFGLGLEAIEHVPMHLSWEGGYKQRNLKIVADSDKVVCITVRELPPGYKGMRFARCYHCNATDHVKSGGCWTVKQARLAGKPGEVLIVG